MSISLDGLTLPDGLAWEDEFTWSSIAQATEYSLTGALIVQSATRQAGRPITLAAQVTGNESSAWIARADLLTLRSALLVADATFTLTLHDGRTFTVAPRHDGDGPLDVVPLSVYKTMRPANPDNAHWYILNAVRLIEV